MSFWVEWEKNCWPFYASCLYGVMHLIADLLVFCIDKTVNSLVLRIKV